MSDGQIIARVVGGCIAAAVLAVGVILYARRPPLPASPPQTIAATMPVTIPVSLSRPKRQLKVSYPEPTYKAMPLSHYVRLTQDRDLDTRVAALDSLGEFKGEKVAAEVLEKFLDEPCTDLERTAAVTSYANVTSDYERCAQVARREFGATKEIGRMVKWMKAFSECVPFGSNEDELLAMMRATVRHPMAYYLAPEMVPVCQRHPTMARKLMPEIDALRKKASNEANWQELLRGIDPRWTP